MPKLPSTNFEQHFRELEQAQHSLRQDRAAMRALLDWLPRCSCRRVARFELADGRYVCRSCADAEDEVAVERVFEWARAAEKLEVRAAAWEDTECGEDAPP